MIDPLLPCVIVLSDEVKPDEIVKNILKIDQLPEGSSIVKNVKGYPWSIDTKYYLTTVNLISVKSDETISEAVLSLTEAVILYFDSKKSESFKNVTKWCDIFQDQLPDVLLLVCDSFKDISPEGTDRLTAHSWCLQNGFELVELADTSSDEGDYSIIPDKKGVERIIEALQTHTWSNLEMKSGARSGAFHQDTDLNPGDLDDESVEGFSELFSQLHSMKESLQSLPLRDRRACAEQVVSTFWKAIGGDDDEIEDIDDIDDIHDILP